LNVGNNTKANQPRKSPVKGILNACKTPPKIDSLNSQIAVYLVLIVHLINFLLSSH